MNMELSERPVETDFALRDVSAFSERSFGGSSKRATDSEALESRAIAELEGRGRKGVEAMLGGLGIAAVTGVGLGGYYGLIKPQQEKQQQQQQRDVS
jgi:uncharacterized protein HemX